MIQKMIIFLKILAIINNKQISLYKITMKMILNKKIQIVFKWENLHLNLKKDKTDLFFKMKKKIKNQIKIIKKLLILLNHHNHKNKI